ncbi:MAG: response regulator [Pleurocapsa sp.]
MTIITRLNPQDLLSKRKNSNSSGCLEFNEGLIYWKVYLQQGKLKYVYCSVQLLNQLKYYLHYLGWKQALTALKKLPPHYINTESNIQETSFNQNLYSKIISWLLAEKYLNHSQGLKLLEHITQDALQSCLWLRKGSYVWHQEHSIPLWIQTQFGDGLSLNLSESLNIEQARLQQWQKCSVQLLSVHQRPYFTSGWEQKALPASGSLNHKILKELAQVIKGSTSIRQLSLLLQKDELHVAQILSPYIDNKIIYLRNAPEPLDRLPIIPRSETNVQQSPSNSTSTISQYDSENLENTDAKTWQIVCIDDSPTILQEIKRFLDKERFEVTAIDDPVQAVPIVFRIKPDLILLDITMPRINGYKLCGLLRASEYCHDTPIIMVTGNTGLIDKARAKLAGATDYFTKPFTRQGLMLMIEKHLK